MVEAVGGEDAEGEAGFVEMAGGGAEEVVDGDLKQSGLDGGDAKGEKEADGEGATQNQTSRVRGARRARRRGARPQ